jgi:hypothetical protein
MKKNTFKKVSVLLVGLLAVVGITYAAVTATMATNGAPWYDNSVEFSDPSSNIISGKEDVFKEALKVDVSKTDLVSPSSGVAKHFSIADFDDLDGRDLMKGVYVTFLNEGNSSLFDGQAAEVDYDKLTNHEPLNTAAIFKVKDADVSKRGIGIYQNIGAQSRVEFLYSTKGLTNVTELQIDVRSYGKIAYINRYVNWEVVAYVYDLAGEYLQQIIYPGAPWYKSGWEAVRDGDPKTFILRTSDTGALYPGDLDNKIILVSFKGSKSEEDITLNDSFDPGATKSTEPLTVFSNAIIKFNRPEVALEISRDKFEAGAGRDALCEQDTLTVEVTDWNTLYRNSTGTFGSGIPNNELTTTFSSATNRQSLYALDKAAAGEEELTYLELTVKYPFVLDEIHASEEGGVSPYSAYQTSWAKLSDLTSAPLNRFEKKVSADGKTTTYRIPREYFVQSDVSPTNPDVHRASVAQFTYHFAPQEVANFTAGNYISATTSAVATGEIAAVKLAGTSIPTYKDEAEVFFDEYLQAKTTPVTFTNLPLFADVYGGLKLTHLSAEQAGTDRYNDDVEHIGWKITYKSGSPATTKVGYIEGEILPATTVVLPLQEVFNEEQFTFGTPAAAIEIIDCTGNIDEDIISIEAILKYQRGDVNVDDKQSLLVNERFTIDPALKYAGGTLGKAYTGQDLIDEKGGATYEGPIVVMGNNVFVWYDFKNDDLLSHALGVTSPIRKALKDKNTVDYFFSPYDERSNVIYQSRPHTVYIKAVGLVPDEPNGTIATLKVFKESFGDLDDGNYHTNGFLFTAPEKENAYWVNNSESYPTKEDATEAVFRGTATTDTLYYTIDLDNVALVTRVKTQGLELKVIYKPRNHNTGGIKKALWAYLGAHNKWGTIPENIFKHVAQFGISTPNKKGFNEFYTLGTTDNGLVTTLNLDYLDGKYTSFYNALLDRFDGPLSSIEGIYKEAFLKDYDTRYVGTCYPTTASQFLVAGLNLLDPVDVKIKTAAGKPAFKYKYTALLDRDGKPYGSVIEGDVTKLVPNGYGEALFLVDVTFDPTDRLGIPLTIDTVGTQNTKQSFYAKYYAKDTITLAPQQRRNEFANRVAFYDLNDYQEEVNVYDERWTLAGIFGSFLQYGVSIKDTLITGIKGDVKVPEIYFSFDPEGEEPIKDTKVDFGQIYAGASENKTVYIQGRDLPVIGTDDPNGGDKIEQIIKISTPSNLLETAPTQWEVLTVSRALAADPGTYKIPANRPVTDIVKDVLRGDVIIPVTLTKTSDKDDLCDVSAELNLTSVCGTGDFLQTLTTVYSPALLNPTIKDIEPGDIGGDYYRVKWNAVPGASFYKVYAGEKIPKYTSENIFISEVRAKNNEIFIELFNGTGKLIHQGLTQNYYVEITKQVGTATATTVKRSVENNFTIQGNTEPIYGKEVKYVPIHYTESNAGLADGTTFTITLKEGENKTIDVFTFSTEETWLARDPYKYAEGVKLPEVTTWDISNWTTLDHLSYPKAYFAWEDEVDYDAESSFNIAPSAAPSIRIYDLEGPKGYTVRVEAYNWCIFDANKKLIPSYYEKDIATSISGGSGDIKFDEASPTGNEAVSAATVQVIGGSGAVTVLNANGKSVTISNVLGQIVAKTVATSDRVTIAAPKGIVVVSVDGSAVKAVVK